MRSPPSQPVDRHCWEAGRLAGWKTGFLFPLKPSAAPLNFLFSYLCLHALGQPTFARLRFNFVDFLGGLYSRLINTLALTTLASFICYFSWQPLTHFTVIGNRFMAITYLLSILFKYFFGGFMGRGL